jgi:hypothetical protein
MSSSEECFAIWAPDNARWTEWAKPAAFFPALSDTPAGAGLDVPIAGLPEAWTDAAIIVDLPGAEAVRAGVQLAERGYRPVPLFNATHGPQPVVEMDSVISALGAGAPVLRNLPIRPDALPAFLLDSRRSNTVGAKTPGWYDNRWIVLPQDLPSGSYLRSHGIADVTLIQRGTSEPATDLAHVLLRWQQAGVRLRVIDLATGRTDENVQVREPSFFRRASYVAIALLGLRRSNVGGFGSRVPEQTASGRGGFYG